jgi:2-aminoadipate transaminase
MTSIERELRRWQDLFAARTRNDVGDGITAIMALANASGIISFGGGFPDPETFPREAAADLMRELAESGDPSPFQYAPGPGLPGLRDVFASRLEQLEGSRPADAELLVTSGGIEALELVCKVFLEAGDLALVEGPSYLGAIMAFRGFDANVGAVPMDDEGLQVDALEDLLRDGARPKLLYTIPDHQNPAGVSLSEERRAALVDLARRFGFLLVEDVAYRELSFDGSRRSSLWSLAPDTVLQIGTTSKIFFPGVRLGWAVGPAEIVSLLVWAKQNTDQCAGALGQRLFEEYARRGLLEEQLGRSRALYARRCGLLLDALERHMPDGVRWTRPEGGFFSWVTLGVDAAELGPRAAAAGVSFVPGAPFYPDERGRDEIRLSFSRVVDEDVEVGVERLGRLVRA